MWIENNIPRPFGAPPSTEGGISLTIPLGEGGLRGIVSKVEGEKMWIENNIPRSIGTPHSTEGETLSVFPLGEGGPRGIVPSIFPLSKGGPRGIVFLPLEQGDRRYEKNEIFQWV